MVLVMDIETPPTRICPLLKDICIKNRCMFWTGGSDDSGKCMVRIIAEASMFRRK